MNYDYSSLRRIQNEQKKTDEQIAAAAKMPVKKLQKVLDNKGQFTQEQIIDICDFLGIPYIDISKFFFCHAQ